MFKITFLIGSLLGLLSTAYTQTAATTNSNDNARVKHFRHNKKVVAIDGYDPVSYFNNSGPLKGAAKRSFTYGGITYHFASDTNLSTFKADPTKYEPAWGGWCGHAMALRGAKVTINPKCYKIINGQNVLFYRKLDANALANWEKELATTKEETLMMKGDDFWNAFLKK
jgi:YHS domain-containing protein